MSNNPKVPVRSSSVKKTTTTSPPHLVPSRTTSLLDVQKRKTSIQDELSAARKRIKHANSYDSEFWTQTAEISTMEGKRLECIIEAGDIESEAGDEDARLEWDSKRAQLLAEQKAAEKWRQISQTLSSRLEFDPTDPKDKDKKNRSMFVKLFNTSSLGFGVKTAGSGRRETTDQSNFRKALIKAYHPPQWKRGAIWDPVLGKKMDEELITAAHLFPCKSECLMDEIFGPGAREELFSPLNGLLLSTKVEKALDKGHLAIVPDVPDPADHALMRAWSTTEPKGYKVVVCSSNFTKSVGMFDADVHGISCLMDLHNRPLHFLTDARPRARYIWWTFLAGITYLDWSQSERKVIKEEVAMRVRYWGTRWRYAKAAHIRSFIEELGQDIESIVDDSSGSGNGEDEGVEAEAGEMAAIAVVSTKILDAGKESRVKAGEESEDEIEDEENDEDEED
ncbi:uncharacterized protein F4817DRAFT_338125 [Daldinia loculata]|uniref:uncharacterized protein n=1 Tax=Daldinia loculata TaxID=103429 RepID=UPI0020C20AD5|nr:uncharacterized protein F4817DRAFT_338125 [Daldinia loculata]KAI1646991.1 hypothetical protein F4817DRAFT_338125 [Daldinia loculata]